jgi:preprotein translocase subunit YajC
MNSLIPDAMAQAAGSPAGGSPMSMFIMMGLFVVVFYFLLIRPQQKKQKEHQAMLGKLAAGDEVVTSGGIVGRIVEISDNFITLEIAENVRIKVQRFQVTTLVPKGTLKGA